MNKKFRKVSKIIQVFLIFTLIFATNAYCANLTSNVEDYAGNGQIGYDDGANLRATFNGPYGLALDKDGGILVVDTGNSLIRKIKNGKVSTVAGSVYKDDVDEFGFPEGGYIDGEALKAKFNNPRGIAIDSKGNIFVADTGNNVIRKIKDGKVYTFAGDGKAGYKNGSKKQAEFNTPSFIVIDKADNLYVSDTLNNVIREITPKGEVKTFAGAYSKNGGYKDGKSNVALFNEPSGIAFNKNGVMFVLDAGNQLIRKIDKNVVSTFCGVKTALIAGTNYHQGDFNDGNSNKAKFNFPKGICIASNNSIIVADTFNNRIRVIDKNGKTVTIAGTGEVGRTASDIKSTTFNQPIGLLYNVGKLYISDNLNNLIRVMKVDLDKLLVANTNNQSATGNKSDPLSGLNLKKTKDIQIWVNKKQVKYSSKPYSNKGVTYVPLNDICNAYGVKLSYDKTAKKITMKKGSFVKTLTKGDISKLLRFSSKVCGNIRMHTKKHIDEMENYPFYVNVLCWNIWNNDTMMHF